MNKAIWISAEMIERDLLERHGPMISDEALRIALGYRSTDAFRQALTRKTVPIPIFSVENRRGKYALVKDLAFWLAKQRNESIRQS
ncbi:hypothetical protein J5N52_08450 [Acinetobacter soli]|uniref:hypothetical protein n=1 Tax=Acinetobacter TaxID=469 RepID=UPI000EA01C6F|nr:MULTISPECIES: hypothetical protein [Acinetobacter]MBO3672047.1 hypothetical protein [Acinetobacter soli]